MGTSDAEQRVLDAARRCCERWGLSKVNVDDIAAEAGISRATLYRLFPGGRDVLFEAMRVTEVNDFFARLRDHLDGVDDVEDVLVRTVVFALADMRPAARRGPAGRADHHVADLH